MDKIDEYMMLLYEDDMVQRIIGTTAILDLVRFPANQEELVQNESLMLGKPLVIIDIYFYIPHTLAVFE
jgi:hypothetical protein